MNEKNIVVKRRKALLWVVYYGCTHQIMGKNYNYPTERKTRTKTFLLKSLSISIKIKLVTIQSFAYLLYVVTTERKASIKSEIIDVSIDL